MFYSALCSINEMKNFIKFEIVTEDRASRAIRSNFRRTTKTMVKIKLLAFLFIFSYFV